MQTLGISREALWKPVAVILALLFLFATVLPKLFLDWWSDENYSHGLLMPFVIGYIVWAEWGRLHRSEREPNAKLGLAIVLVSLGLLLIGILGSELFSQRLSLVSMLAGVILYFFGAAILRILLVPFVLLLFSIPIPQILFNKIALPLQFLASKIAGYGITALGIDVSRKGNIIELIPLGTDQIVGLEVVEACSGIRSLMSLAALAVLLVYLTRRDRPTSGRGFFSFLKDADFIRGVILVLSAAPIALFTNALRVTLTGALTYYRGPEGAVGPGHDALGWLTFLGGLVLLILENEILRKFMGRWGRRGPPAGEGAYSPSPAVVPPARVLVLLAVILLGGLGINWFDRRGEVPVVRRPLAEMPLKIGEWWKVGGDTRFSVGTEDVLRASDYVMRNYFTLHAHKSNLYVGYYESQRTGATYHSPQNCLPGSGWQMTDGKTMRLTTPAGRALEVNRYIVHRGDNREVMVYWYQGRGRTNANEYLDKFYKIRDSIVMRRSDGAMVRIMTNVANGDEQQAEADALDLAAHVADSLGPFVPE